MCIKNCNIIPTISHNHCSVQAKAISVMPVEQLNTEARAKFAASKRENPALSEDLLRDILLLERKE